MAGLMDYLNQATNFLQNDPRRHAVSGAAQGFLRNPYDIRQGLADAGQGFTQGGVLGDTQRRQAAMDARQAEADAVAAAQRAKQEKSDAAFGDFAYNQFQDQGVVSKVYGDPATDPYRGPANNPIAEGLQNFGGAGDTSLGGAYDPAATRAAAPDFQKNPLVGKALFEQSLAVPKTTTGMQDFRAIQAERAASPTGESPYEQYQLAQKAAGASNVSVRGSTSETKQDEKIGAALGDFEVMGMQGGAAARSKIQKLDVLSAALKDPSVYQGTGAQSVLQLKKIAQGFGFDVEGISGAEVTNAIGNGLALEIRNPSGGAGMPGAMSERDVDFLVAQVPGLANSPEGNMMIIEIARRQEQRSIEVAKIINQYRKDNGRVDQGIFEVIAEFAEANDLFGDLKTEGLSGLTNEELQSKAEEWERTHGGR